VISYQINEQKEKLALLESQNAAGLEIAENFSKLGNLYCSDDMYSEAEPCYWRAVELKSEHLGPAHIDVVFSLLDLAELYELQAEDAKAEQLYECIVAILLDLPIGVMPEAIRVIERLAGYYGTRGQPGKVSGLEGLIYKFRHAELACPATA